MTKAFTKGDEVTLFGRWSDRRGVVAFFCRDAVVYSCGKKRMVLTDAATGEEIGRNFQPRNAAVEGVDVWNYNGENTFPRMPGPAARDKAIELARAYADKLAADYQARAENPNLADYADDYRATAEAYRNATCAFHQL